MTAFANPAPRRDAEREKRKKGRGGEKNSNLISLPPITSPHLL